MTDESAHIFAASILAQTIRDWRACSFVLRNNLQPKALVEARIREIRQFLESEWCELLLTSTTFTPDLLIRRMEKELEEGVPDDCRLHLDVGGRRIDVTDVAAEYAR